jgi:hypothetical protein
MRWSHLMSRWKWLLQLLVARQTEIICPAIFKTSSLQSLCAMESCLGRLDSYVLRKKDCHEPTGFLNTGWHCGISLARNSQSRPFDTGSPRSHSHRRRPPRYLVCSMSIEGGFLTM